MVNSHVHKKRKPNKKEIKQNRAKDDLLRRITDVQINEKQMKNGITQYDKQKTKPKRQKHNRNISELYIWLLYMIRDYISRIRNQVGCK